VNKSKFKSFSLFPEGLSVRGCWFAKH